MRALRSLALALALACAPALGFPALGASAAAQEMADDAGSASTDADGPSAGTQSAGTQSAGTQSAGTPSAADDEVVSPPPSGSSGVSTQHGSAHTSSSTTTRSGSAPAAHHDASTDPVVDPVTQPPVGAARSAPPEEEEDEGDGRDVDFIWIEVQGGVSNVNLIQFQNQNFADVAMGAEVFNEVYGTGPAVGVGLGFRVWWLAVGARASFAGYDGFQIGTLGGEATLRLPIPIVEPWIRAGFGYAWQGDASYEAGVATRQTTTYGWTFQAGVGVDIYLVNWLTIGAGFGLDVLNMTRQSDPTAMCMGVTDVCPMQNGDALGLQLKGLLTLGLRF